jgi:hypothetical protein
MSGRTSTSNLLRVAAVLVVAYAIVFVVTPFSTAKPGPQYALRNFQPRSGAPISESGTFLATVPQVHCSAPVIDAWRAPAASSGWFGYAPLTGTPVVFGSGCRETSRRRLRLSALGLVIAFGLVLVARRLDRRPGYGLDPAPS